MSEADVQSEIAAIHARLAALATRPPDAGVAQEIGAIRAQLRSLALSNAEIGDRLGESLGLRNPRPD